MRVPGFCSECRRTRHVHVSGAEIARWSAMGRQGMIQGICSECEDKKRDQPRG